jgi:hypothetical protein
MTGDWFILNRDYYMYLLLVQENVEGELHANTSRGHTTTWVYVCHGLHTLNSDNESMFAIYTARSVRIRNERWKSNDKHTKGE